MARLMLPRLLSRWGVASRKQAEALVHAGRVTVNGRVVRKVTTNVDERAQVMVDGVVVGATGEAVWFVLNKPRGVMTTTSDPQGRATVMELVGEDVPGLAPVGRLDRDSAGLLLLTNEHTVAAGLLDPARHVEKVYRVKVGGHPGDEALTRLRTTTVVDDGLTLGPMDVEVAELGPKSAWLTVTLREGKNRQIRRRLAAEGHEVETLVRVRFGPVDLGELAPGASRRLTDDELAALRRAARAG